MRQCLHLRGRAARFDPFPPRSGTKLRIPEFRNALARSGIIAHSKRHVETHPFTPRKAITLLANVIIDNANVDKIICLLIILYYYCTFAFDNHNWNCLGKEFLDHPCLLIPEFMCGFRQPIHVIIFPEISWSPLSPYPRNFLWDIVELRSQLRLRPGISRILGASSDCD